MLAPFSQRFHSTKVQGVAMQNHSLRRGLGALSLCFALIVSSFLPISAQQRRLTRANAPAKKVKLVVGIMIDQFRYDYLTRFADLFGEGGFKRLLTEGAVFTNANYLHTPTYTACGHATFLTGAPPALTGIVGNEWYDRETGRRITSVADAKTKLLGGKEGPGMSPHRLLASTLGDELRLTSNQQSKVIGLSYKDRSAILPAGKRPNGAYWYDNTTGNFVSSTYYFNELPAWAQKFNREQRADQYFGKKWERLLPEAAYQRATADDSPHERATSGNKFPHTINGAEAQPGGKFYAQFEMTPFANELLVALTKAAIENEQLGADDTPDVLTISFSANDLAGHYFGPYSHEVEDITVRTDRLLADLFSYLDKKIGLEQTLIALSADHGVAPIPEQTRELGYGGRIEPKALTEAAQTALNKRFGEDQWVKLLVNGNIYLDEAAIERHKADVAEVERVAASAVQQVNGVMACLTSSQINSNQLPPGLIAQSVAHGFYAPRNGNLIIVPRAFHFISEGTVVITTHGTPYNYDTHVPVILLGPGVAAGHYHNAASPADIAPTLAVLLKVQTPSNSIGRVLSEAFKQ
jgi:predicted AlkP superfamily pyrophosphatase or phosphodiesterase